MVAIRQIRFIKPNKKLEAKTPGHFDFKWLGACRVTAHLKELLTYLPYLCKALVIRVKSLQRHTARVRHVDKEAPRRKSVLHLCGWNHLLYATLCAGIEHIQLQFNVAAEA